MKRFVQMSLLVLIGLAVCAAAIGAQMGKKAVVWPAANITWTDNPAVKGAKMAVLWGDPKTGAYGALKKVPGGSSLGWHTHTQDQKVILIAGTMSFSVDSGTPKQLTQGSYASIPGTKHSADCTGTSECVYFEEQPGATDFNAVKTND